MLSFKTDTDWTLFLDRDGVINRRDFEGYITKIEDFEFLPFVMEGMRDLCTQFSKIIIVTNQQGVSKGIFSEEQLEKIHNYMLREFAKQGIKISRIYSATNLRGAENDRRKPNINMGWEAKTDFPEIDFQKSLMVGDTDSDIQFGKNLGMKTVLIKSEEPISVKADGKVNNLKELADALK